MTDALNNAISCASEILTTVSGNTILAVLAFGFPLAKGGIKTIKRLARIGG